MFAGPTRLFAELAALGHEFWRPLYQPARLVPEHGCLLVLLYSGNLGGRFR